MLGKYALIKAMLAIFSEPNSEFSVRDLARAAKISPGASGSALHYMAGAKMVSRKVIGRTHQYRANLESPLCRQWKVVFNLGLIEKSGLAEGIVKKTPNVLSVLLYGSYAKGTNDRKSDIDILVITQQSEEVRLNAPIIGSSEVNIISYSMAEWKKKALREKVFYENAVYDSLVLFGERPVVT